MRHDEETEEPGNETDKGIKKSPVSLEVQGEMIHFCYSFKLGSHHISLR